MTIAVRRPRPYMNVAAFKDLIAPYPAHERWELLDGEPQLMSPQSERHQRIVARLQRICDRLADALGCVAVPGSASSAPPSTTTLRSRTSWCAADRL